MTTKYLTGLLAKITTSLSPQGVILLDDAARPGERIIARRWSRKWQDFSFEGVGTKGLLVGRRRAYDDHRSA